MARKLRYDPKCFLQLKSVLKNNILWSRNSRRESIRDYGTISQYSVQVQAEPEETVDNVLNEAQEALNVLIVSVVSSSGTLLDITRCDASRV